MTCCRCNRTGRCQNCSCVKNGYKCENCLPLRLGNCANTVHTQLGHSAPAPAVSTTSVPASTMNLDLDLEPTPNSLTNSDHPELPPFEPLSEPVFSWGEYSSSQFCDALDSVYMEAIHWKINLFKVPYGKAGKAFVSEMASLFKAFATKSALESIAIKAAILLPILALQKPNRQSKVKEHITCLERRLATWREGNILNLLKEGRTIQQRLPNISAGSARPAQLARSFANLMFQGKTRAALRLLSNQNSGGTLHLNDMIDTTNGPRKVRDILADKHPPGQPVCSEAIIEDSSLEVHPVLFESIDATTIKSAALRTSGAAGPSGLDALSWRRLCTSFKSASVELCHYLALTARRLCTEFVHPVSIAPLLASRLIPLNKNPGVRPIGIGDTSRRIIAKAILSVTRQDVQDVAGSIQLCAGQISGIEAAVHATQDIFQNDATEAIILVDASNAFNALNRQTALHNIQKLCPTLATVLINTYRSPTDLYVDGDTLLSQEGTTQGDPLAMPMYALATIPLIKKLKDNVVDVTQVWYADDAAGAGKVSRLRDWWDHISRIGPMFGYFPNPSKTWVITKEEFLSSARCAFDGTEVNLTSSGRPYLGTALGAKQFAQTFVSDKVQEWSSEVETLATIAHSQPHAAYAAFTHGLMSKWTYLSRTMWGIGQLLQPLENVIRTKLLPALSGRPPPNEVERELFSLPARLGGIAISNPSNTAELEFNSSIQVTIALKEAILQQEFHYTSETLTEQTKARSEVQKLRRDKAEQASLVLKDLLPRSLKFSMELAQEKGASSWLTSLPIEEYGFSLHKSAFRDALALRYDWQPISAPSTCGCGAKFSIEHVLSCPKGGFPSIRHNEIRDLTANMLTEVCSDVCVEPDLQPITGEQLTGASSNIQDGARLDIAANGIWGGRYERTFFDVRIFNPHARSNRQTSLATCYRKHESIKKRTYEQRVREVEHASFTPLVLSASGGMASEATTFYKHLASKLATKWEQSYSHTLSWLRTRITFSLLRSAIQCIRGARSSCGHAIRIPQAIDLAVSELHISST